MAEEIIRTEICIVGAGPAGAAASISLSKEGIRHIVADAAVFPRHKPCGDILTSGVLRALRRLNPEILTRLKEMNLLAPVWKTKVFPPNGKPISLDFLPLDGEEGQASCYSVSRYDLDLVLVNLIKASPFAVFRENCRIKAAVQTQGCMRLETEDGPVIEAGMVIFATGSGSSILNALGHPAAREETAVGIRAHYEGVKWDPSVTGLFLHPECMPGGLYLTPLPGGKCNVNLVISLEKVRKEKLQLREKMEELLRSIPALKEAFSAARKTGNPEGSKLYLGTKPRKVSGERYLLAGDAAGLIEFFSGNGIPQAYASGEIAAGIAATTCKERDFSAMKLKRYDAELYRKIRTDKIGGQLIFPLLHRPLVSRMVLRFLNYLSSRPRTNDMLRDLLYARNPAKILRRPSFYLDLFRSK
jgi:flavin-dependent dehydrogenase